MQYNFSGAVKAKESGNTFVKSEDAGKYFEVISVDLTAIPTCAYKSLDELPKDGFYIENAMTKTQMVMKDDIADKDIVMDKYKNGYEITSFPAESFDGGVNGSLRKGDVVDVYALNPETELLELFAENVYVSEVYDNAGNRITEPDGVATSFTVWVTPEEVDIALQLILIQIGAGEGVQLLNHHFLQFLYGNEGPDAGVLRHMTVGALQVVSPAVFR